MKPSPPTPASIFYNLSLHAQLTFAMMCNSEPVVAVRPSVLDELKAAGLASDDGHLTELGHAARADDLRWYNEYLSMHT